MYLLSLCVLSLISLQVTAISQELLDILVIDSAVTNHQCLTDSQKLRRDFQDRKTWAWKMLDSSSKIPTGVFYGSSQDFGHFDQCLSIEEGSILGKHCMASIQLKINNLDAKQNIWNYVQGFQNNSLTRKLSTLSLAFCIPSSCKEEDLNNHLQIMSKRYIQEGFDIQIDVPAGYCRTNEQYAYNFYDNLFLIVVGSIILWVFLSTIIDVFGPTGKPSVYYALVKSFSLDYNMKKVLAVHNDVDNLNCIHGFRVVSTFIVVVDHIIFTLFQSSIYNLLEVQEWFENSLFRVLLSFHSCVDLFFVLTAFLTAYALLHDLESKKRFSYFKFYLHRFIRCTPLNALIIFFYATVFSKLSNSPLWSEVMDLEKQKCVENWWASLLNINNYVYTDKICVLQTWFLSASMQMFILTPPIVIFLHKYPKRGTLTVLGLILLLTGINFYQVYMSDMDAVVIITTNVVKDLTSDSFKMNYIPTHTRAAPYLLGLLAALLKFQMKFKDVRLPEKSTKICYYISWSCPVYVLYKAAYFVVNSTTASRFETALFSSVYHLLIGFSVCYGIVAMSSGYADKVKAIFGWTGFIPYSRITYSVNLCNFSIVIFIVALTRVPLYVNKLFLIWHLSSTIVLTYAIGLAIYLCFEAPFVNLDKFLLNTNQRVTTKNVDSSSKVKLEEIMDICDEIVAIANLDVANLEANAQKYIDKLEQKFDFPELNENENRSKVWSGLYDLIKNEEIIHLHANLLTLARIFSRDKTNLGQLITEKWVDLLIEKAGLKNSTKVDEEITRTIAVEALKCICNVIFNCKDVAIICSENGLPKAIIERVRIYQNLDFLQIKYFDIKILFLITALCRPIRNVLKDDLNGLKTLIESLEKFLEHISKNIVDPKTDIQKVLLSDLQIDYCCELLKVLFNITLYENAEEQYHKTLVVLLHHYLLLPVTNKSKKMEIHSHIVNLLTNIPGTCYKYLLTSAVSGISNKFVYNKKNMLAVQELVYFLENKFDTEMTVSNQRDSLLPILSVLLKCAISNRNMRKYLKIQILPPLKNVHSRPEDGKTLRNHLCRLLTTPITEVRDFVAELLFVLCKENVSRMIKYTGYGNAAGLFANRGLLAGQNKNVTSSKYSSDSDSDTEEYKEFKHGINPVMGCFEEPHANPFENMTEEQKEYEAMKLVELMDTLTKHGIIQPCKVGKNGKPEAIEHVLQLQEGMKNFSVDSDSD